MQLPEGFSIATEQDIPQLNILVNSAYRGDSSRKGWTTEADFLEGIRVDEQALKDLIAKPNAVIITYRKSPGQIIACVYLEKQEDNMYLGMLTVNPELQANGLGKKLMEVAEDYAKGQQSKAVVMTVITQRDELIAWYNRRGYHSTGEKKPFPNDPRFGIPKIPLEFVVMKKELTA
jgi:N-acetylglutamate synthase-like GNAT family acetyltransferase